MTTPSALRAATPPQDGNFTATTNGETSKTKGTKFTATKAKSLWNL
ncbi:MAG: hypothetical protein LBL00_01335 [Endomicrobium sp.]|nr:hypothetical protein [Endomicrobium sp.]